MMSPYCSVALGSTDSLRPRRWCPPGHYQPYSLICSQPSSMSPSISSASSGERHPKVRARAASRSTWLIGLSRRMKLAAISSLSGGSAFRSSKMFSRGLTTLKVYRHDRPGKQQQELNVWAGKRVGGKRDSLNCVMISLHVAQETPNGIHYDHLGEVVIAKMLEAAC